MQSMLHGLQALAIGSGVHPYATIEKLLPAPGKACRSGMVSETVVLYVPHAAAAEGRICSTGWKGSLQSML